jgi:iron complex transport system ATP-binding protein
MQPLLAIKDLTVSLAGRRIVESAALEITSGEIVALAGPNGSGKTTLLKAAAGILRYEGSVQVNGVDLASISRRQRARLLAYVPQHSALEAALTVEEVVAQGRLAHRSTLGGPGAEDRGAVSEALRELDVENLAQRPFNQLSFGERRRVLIARALATRASLLLMDEPTAALDVRHILDLFAVLRRLSARGYGMLVVLHQLREVVEIAHRAALLHGGRLRFQGSVDRVIARDPVRQVYGVDLVPNATFGYSATAARAAGQ